MSTNKNTNLVAIITMCFIFAMISVVTNMGAPFGNIWGFKYEFAASWGNLMNFVAYLFMGIPSGMLLKKIGYKKTALAALIVGIIGLALQYLSSIYGDDIKVNVVGGTVVALNLYIYLLGALVCGFCVCMLNTVVNPMLNILGGGGVADAYKAALHHANEDDFIFVGGSSYIVADFLTLYDNMS